MEPKRQLVYLGSSQKDARKLPDEVQELFAYALDVALKGGQHEDAKPLIGFHGRSVIEVLVITVAIHFEKCIQFALKK